MSRWHRFPLQLCWSVSPTNLYPESEGWLWVLFKWVGPDSRQASLYGYVGGEVGRPRTTTTDKVRRAFLWGWRCVAVFTLDWCWFFFCFLIPIYCGNLRTLPKASKGNFSLRAKAKYCFWQGVHGQRERGRKVSICSRCFHHSSVIRVTIMIASQPTPALCIYWLWDWCLLGKIHSSLWFLELPCFLLWFLCTPNSLAFLFCHIPHNSSHTDVTFFCFPWWLWFQYFCIYFWLSSTLT